MGEVVLVDGSSLQILNQFIMVGDNILQLLTRIKHSRTICIKLYEKVSSCQQFVKNLPQYYQENSRYFYLDKYLKIFEVLNKLYEQTFHFLKNIKNKSKIVRLANSDKYRLFIYDTLVGLDTSLSQLKLNLFVTQRFDKLVLDKIPKLTIEKDVLEINQDRSFIEKDIERLNYIQSILNLNLTESDKLKRFMQIDPCDAEIKTLLKEIEVARSDIEPIPDSIPRKGNKYTVYKCRYKGKIVAEKILNDKFEGVRLINTYKRHILLSNQLKTCHFILPVLGISTGSSLGLICEYSELGSLKSYLESSTALNYDIQLKLTENIVEGLAFLHELDILHKDLKTSNITVDNNLKAKLAGFEFVRYSSKETEVYDQCFDTDRIRWLAPEKVQGYNHFTKACDIFSLGTIIWSIFSLKYPYAKLTRKKVETILMQGKRENLSLIPTDVQPIVAACWKQLGHNRPGIEDILEVLDWLTIKALNGDQFVDLNSFDQFGLNFYFNIDKHGNSGVITDEANFQSKENSFDSHDISFIFNCYSYDFNLEENRRVGYSTYCCDDILPTYFSSSNNSNQDLNFSNILTDLTKYNTHTVPNRTKEHIRSSSDFSLQINSTNKHLRSRSDFTLDSFDSKDCTNGKTNLKVNGERFNFFIETDNVDESEEDFKSCFESCFLNLNHQATLKNKRYSSSEVKLRVGMELQFELDIPDSDNSKLNPVSNYFTVPDPNPINQLNFHQFNVLLTHAIQFYNHNRRLEAFQLFDQLSQLVITFLTTTNPPIINETFERNLSQVFYYLGYYYFWGESSVCKINYKLAYQHFQLSASYNNSDAIDHLGLYYWNLDVGEVNYIKAFKLFKEAAMLNNRKGFYHLAICYLKGRGTFINRKKANLYFQKANELGHPLAKLYL